MNKESKYRLYEGITNISDDIIEEAESVKHKKRRPVWVKWSAIAACMCLVAGGIYSAAQHGLFDGMGSNAGGGGKDGITYMSYAGPVFPLTVLEDASGLTATRQMDFDFSPYKSHTESYEADGKVHEYDSFKTESIVTDGYVLTNTSQTEKRVTAVYPFAASFSSDADTLPAITVNGNKVSSKLNIGPYSGTFEGAWGGTESEKSSSLNLDSLDSWEKYKALIKGGYMESAFDDWPQLNQTVIVYELRDRKAPSDADDAVTLNMEFNMDNNKTTILTYGFNGAANDVEKGHYARSTHIPKSSNPDYGTSAYLIVLGEDISGYTLQGYKDGSCEAGKELDSVTATVVRYETTLDNVFHLVAGQFLDLYLDAYSGDASKLEDNISRESIIGAYKELLVGYGVLSSNTMQRYDFGMLEDVFGDAQGMDRIMYLSFEATVPAGGSVEISCSMVKKASIDFTGKNKNRNGYDMVTQLGSSLSFTAQNASITNTESIQIINQNFGFDLAKGITTVELNPSQEHYFLEVRKLSK